MKFALIALIIIFVSGGCATSKKAERLKELQARDEEIQKLDESANKYYNAIDLEASMKAAERGEALHQHVIADLYRVGIQLPKNERLAFIWNLKAAHQGLVMSQIKISDCYAQGIGVIQDDIKAYAWANLANSVADSTFSIITNKKINETKNKLSKDQIAISQALAIKLYEEIYGEEQENPVNKVIH